MMFNEEHWRGFVECPSDFLEGWQRQMIDMVDAELTRLRAEVPAGAHLVATVGDRNRELENRLSLADAVVKAARKADGKLPPHSLIFDAEYYCFAEKLRAALSAYDAALKEGK